MILLSLTSWTTCCELQLTSAWTGTTASTAVVSNLATGVTPPHWEREKSPLGAERSGACLSNVSSCDHSELQALGVHSARKTLRGRLVTSSHRHEKPWSLVKLLRNPGHMRNMTAF